MTPIDPGDAAMSNEAAVIVATPDGLVRYETFGEFAEAEMGRAAAIAEARRRERRNTRARELRAQRSAGKSGAPGEPAHR
jgi:hypothetical protein